MAGRKRRAKKARKSRTEPKTASERAPDDFRPQRVRRDGQETPRDEGPLGWFLEQIEASYTRLSASDAAPVAAVEGTFPSLVQPAGVAPQLADAGSDGWLARLREYRDRKAKAVAPVAGPVFAPAAPFVPGARNWLPLGPTVVLDGQTVGEQPVAGRVVGLAVGPGAQPIYAATAAGGVFRSDDGGSSWTSLMDGFDLNPTNFASASLACGAIAVVPDKPHRVYVGTGEGDTHALFRSRVVNALPAYRGIGPITSVDGGQTWTTEPVASGAPELAGEAFFALALDPVDAERPVAATTAGLYQRELDGNGDPRWARRLDGVHSSVVFAAGGGTRRFAAALWGGPVRFSDDGATWRDADEGFPASDVGRIALAVRPDDPNTVYALVARESSGTLLGVFRLDGVEETWRRILSPPRVLPAVKGRSQGTYDLAIAVDPNDRDIVYLGGSFAEPPAPGLNWPWPASVWRTRVRTSSSGAMSFSDKRSIGTHAHADVHVLVHTPGESNELWCGCDGGVFLNRDPRNTGEFAAQNTGLSCLCCNFIAQHPEDAGVLLTGLQDNGTAHTSGSPMWRHVNGGDGGYCLINWADPSRAISFVNGRFYRSTTGGDSHSGWLEVWNFGWATMTQPLVGVPLDPSSPESADVIAIGAGNLVFVSTNFGTTWPLKGRIELPGGNTAGSVFALAFASRTRLYIGTTLGRVFRADHERGRWTVERLDDAATGPLPVSGLIADVAVDLGAPGGEAIYVAFSGMGERRRVWRYDGVSWEARSGPANGGLLDVEHNALVVDPAAPDNIYVGADIGVWHSPDAGRTWTPFENGLPDAPVFDLQIHPAQRLLRAATHGRGVYEIALD